MKEVQAEQALATSVVCCCSLGFAHLSCNALGFGLPSGCCTVVSVGFGCCTVCFTDSGFGGILLLDDVGDSNIKISFAAH